MATSRTLENLVAKAIFDGLKRRNSRYVSGEPAPHVKTTIDGDFYLMAVARHVLKAIQTASPPQ